MGVESRWCQNKHACRSNLAARPCSRLWHLLGFGFKVTKKLAGSSGLLEKHLGSHIMCCAIASIRPSRSVLATMTAGPSGLSRRLRPKLLVRVTRGLRADWLRHLVWFLEFCPCHYGRSPICQINHFPNRKCKLMLRLEHG